MVLDDEKYFGAEILPSPEHSANTTPSRPHLTVEPTAEYSSMTSQYPTPKEEYDPTSTHPFSPFYSHPTTRTSFEQLKSTSAVVLKVYETDLEAGSPIRHSTSQPPPPTKDCAVWPGKQQLKQKSLAMKKSRVCSPLRNLSKKQRLWVKILIGFFIVGVAVGVGVGISKATGTGVWKSNTQQVQIGEGS